MKRKVAVIHDWLVTYAGSERVLEQILSCYPQADLFSLIDFIPSEGRSFLRNKKTKISFIQNLPFAKKKYRNYLPIMPWAIESLDLTEYDLIISSSHAVAKGVLTTPKQLHICYLQARNLKYAYEDRGFYPKNKLSGFIQDYFLSKIRIWDSVASHRPDLTIANSHFVKRWHKHRHNIPASVIYPPVDTDFFSNHSASKKGEYYVTVGRLEPYKKIDLIIETFKNNEKKLIVIGDGTQRKSFQKLALKNISFLGYCNKKEIAEIVGGAKGFIFASREDFGIAPIEAQACGTPVIALGQGGTLETIQGLEQESPTGVFFEEQTIESLSRGIEKYEKNASKISCENCKKNAIKFRESRFREQFTNFVESSWVNFLNL